MSWIDFILNIAGLLLWLNWRAVPPLTTAPAGAAEPALPRRADPPRARWWYLLGLRSCWLDARFLLAGRFEPQVGPGHSVQLHLRSRSAAICRGAWCSSPFSAFGVTWAFFIVCLLLLSWVYAPVSDVYPAQRLVRLHWVGWSAGPSGEVAAPAGGDDGACGALSIRCCSGGLEWCPGLSTWQLLGAGGGHRRGGLFYAAVSGTGVSRLYVLNSYVYLGDFPFLNFVNTTSRGLLRPLRLAALATGPG